MEELCMGHRWIMQEKHTSKNLQVKVKSMSLGEKSSLPTIKKLACYLLGNRIPKEENI